MQAAPANVKNFKTFMDRDPDSIIERVACEIPDNVVFAGIVKRIDYTSDKWGKKTVGYYHDIEEEEPLIVVQKVDDKAAEGGPFKTHQVVDIPDEYPNFGTLDVLVVVMPDGDEVEFNYEHRTPRPAFTCSEDRKKLHFIFFQQDDQVPNLYMFNKGPRQNVVMTADGLIC